MGRVTTEDGLAIAGAKVELSSSALVAGTLVTTTNDRGVYRFQLLPIGQYTLKITAENYQGFELSDITMRIGDTITINPVLKTGAFEEVITITGESPLIDVTTTSMSESLGKELIAKLPVPRFPSDLRSLAAANVGTSTQGSADSASDAYKLDGVDVSDPQTGTVWVFVNIESIDEMELIPAAGNDASVGGFTGAALNMVTKSGGNEFSGGFAYYYFDKDFITWNTDDEAIRDRTSRYALNNDFTVFLGGPIAKDRLWFFGNMGLRKEGNLQRTKLNTQKYRNTMWKVSGIIGDDMNFSGLYHYDNYLVDGRFAAYNHAVEATADQDGPNHSFALNWAWVIDDYNLLEAKFHGWDGRFGYEGKGSGAYMYDTVLDWGYNNSPYDYMTWRDRTSFEAIYTRYADEMYGSHEVKGGLEYHTGSSDYEVRYDWILLENGNPYYRYGYLEEKDSGIQKTKTWVAYVTDSWNINDSLLLNVGLRYERPTYNIPAQGDIHTLNNLAPRIGFTYKLDSEGKTLVRGSWGRYYDPMATGLLQSMDTSGADWIEQVYSGGQWFEVYRESPSGLYAVDPDLSGQYTEAFTIGFERELMPNMAFGADFVHRRSHDITVEKELGRIWEQVSYTFESKRNSEESGSRSAIPSKARPTPPTTASAELLITSSPTPTTTNCSASTTP